MRDLSLMISAGQVEEIAAVGSYLRIKSASAPLLIEIDGGKSRFEVAKGGSAKLMPFTRFSVSHASPVDQAVVIAIGGEGEEQTEGVMTGEVAVNNLRTISQSQAASATRRTVAQVSGAIVSANPNRAFLCIQNQDDVGTIWISPTTVAPGTGWRLGPGECLEFSGGIVFTGAMSAISDAASNPNILVLEGRF